MTKSTDICRKVITVVCCLSLIAGTAVATGFSGGHITAESDRNLVINGDAEAGNTDGWTWTDQKVLKADIDTGTAEPALSHKSGNIGGEHYFDSWGYNAVVQTVTLEANTDYEFSMNYYATNFNATVVISDDSGKLKTIQGSVSANQWNTAKGSFTTGDGTTVTLTINSGWGQYYFDNVSVVRTGLATIVRNGDAESGNAENWNCTSGKVMKAISSETDTAAASTTHKSGNIGGNHYFNSWGWNTITQTVTLEADTSYMFSMNYYAANYNASVTLNDGTSDLISIPASVTIGEWKTASGIFKTADTVTVTITINTGWAEYCFDNVAIVKDESDVDSAIVKNGTAEKGKTAYWKWKDGKDVVTVNSASDTSDVAAAHRSGSIGGDYFFRSWGFNTISQTVTLEANTTYEFRMSYYAINGNASVKITDGTDTLMQVSTANIKSWSPVDCMFTTSGITSISIQINSGWSEYCFDNVEIIKSGYPTEPVAFTDGDFESGRFVPKGAYGGWNGGSAVYINGDKPRNGDCSLWIQWDWNAVTQTFRVEPNTEYKLKFSYCAGDQSGMAIYKFCNVEDQSVYTEQTLGTSKSWATCEISFTTGDYDVLRLYLSATLNTYLDDVSFTEVPTYTEKDPTAPCITTFSFSKFYLVEGGTNLIADGDFEKEPEGGWNIPEFIGTDALSISEEKSRSGSKSLKFSADSDTKQSAILWIDVRPNTDYVIQMSLLGEYMSKSNLADMVVELVNERTQNALKTGTSSTSGIVPARWDNTWHRRAVAFNSGYAEKIGIRIRGSHASCFLDDIVLCHSFDVTEVPQAADKAADLRLADYDNAITVDYGTDIVTCATDKNLLSEGDFSGSYSAFWDTLLSNSAFTIADDYKDTANRILKYDSTAPRFNNCITWVNIDRNTKYSAYVRIRGDREGDGAFTVVTGAKIPIRLVKYTPDRWDGVWQTYSMSFNSGDDGKIGFAFLDGGGALSIDDVVLCRYEDATFTEAPELPPIGGYPAAGDGNTGSSSGGHSGTVKPVNNAVSSATGGTTEGGQKVIKKPGSKGKTTVYEYEVTDWVTTGVIIGVAALAVIGGTVTLILVLKKKKKKKALETAGGAEIPKTNDPRKDGDTNE